MADSVNESRKEIVQNSIKMLEINRGYRNPRALGSGSYGDVLKMYDPRKDSDFAVKVITYENIAEMEMVVWPQLSHPNIEPCIDLLRGPQNTAIFLMPLQETSLFDKLRDRDFRSSKGCILFLKDWLHDVLCGLEYLHLRKVCHLDLKSDNILITPDYHAMVCDFSFINSASKPLERSFVGTPYKYRPPEASECVAKDTKIDGVAYDMWTYGIMIVELFTYFVVSRKVSGGKYWQKDVFPILFNALQKKQFEDAVAETFPVQEADADEASLALNFIHLFLKPDPKDRFTTIRAMRHPFLNTGTNLGPAPDPIWIPKVSATASIENDDSLPRQSSLSPHQAPEQIEENNRGSSQNTEDNSSNIASTGLKAESPLSKNKRNHLGIRKWLRKKLSSFGKLFKCCFPANIRN